MIGDPLCKAIAGALAEVLFENAWFSFAENLDFDRKDNPECFPPGVLERLEHERLRSSMCPDVPRELMTVSLGILAYIGATNGNVDVGEVLRYNTLLSGHRVAPSRNSFGYCLAHEMLGSGVGWDDDHPHHELVLPRLECHLYFADLEDDPSAGVRAGSCAYFYVAPGIPDIRVEIPADAWSPRNGT